MKLSSIAIGGYPLNIGYNEEKDEFYVGCLLKITDLIPVYYDLKKRKNGTLSDDLTVNSMIIKIKNSKKVS